MTHERSGKLAMIQLVHGFTVLKSMPKANLSHSLTTHMRLSGSYNLYYVSNFCFHLLCSGITSFQQKTLPLTNVQSDCNLSMTSEIGELLYVCIRSQ